MTRHDGAAVQGIRDVFLEALLGRETSGLPVRIGADAGTHVDHAVLRGGIEDEQRMAFAAKRFTGSPAEFSGLAAAATSAVDSAAFLHLVLDAMPVLQLAIFDRDLRYVYVSPGAIVDPSTRQWIIGRDDVE